MSSSSEDSGSKVSKKHKKHHSSSSDVTPSPLRAATKGDDDSSSESDKAKTRTLTIKFGSDASVVATIKPSTSTEQLVAICLKELKLDHEPTDCCLKVIGKDAEGNAIDGLLDESMNPYETDEQLVAEKVTYHYVLAHEPVSVVANADLGTSAKSFTTEQNPMLSPRGLLKSESLRETRETNRRRRDRKKKGSTIEGNNDAETDGEDRRSAWAKYEARLMAALNDASDALRAQLFVPPAPCDIEIQSLRRQHRLPDDALLGELTRKDKSMQFAIDVFKRDWEIISFPHRHVVEPVIHIDESAPSIDVGDSVSFWRDESQTKVEKRPVTLDEEFLQSKGKWLTEEIEPDDSTSFLGLFAVEDDSKVSTKNDKGKSRREKALSPSALRDKANESRSTVNFQLPHLVPKLISASSRAMRVLIEAIDLRFEMPPVEPLYCQLQIYNIREKRRLSEIGFIYGEYNPTLIDLGKTQTSAAPETQVQKLIVTIDEPNADVYIVLRVMCVLRGSEEPFEPYFGSNKQIKTKEMAALVNKANDFCVRFGQYQQPFAVGVLPLLTDNGQLASTPLSIENMQPWTQPIESLLEKFQGSANRGVLSLLAKDKTLNGKFTLKLTQLSEADLNEIRGRLSPSMVQLKPLGDETIDHRSMRATSREIKFVRELQQLPNEKEMLFGLTEYFNNLYIIVESVNLASLPSLPNKCSLVVQIEIKSDDMDVNARGEKIVYGRGSEPLFVSKQDSSCQYDSKKPFFVDEFKVALPPHVGAKFNALFTIFNIGVKKTGDAERTPLAYAFLPLVEKDGKIIQDGRHQLMVFDQINATYMTQTPKSFDKRPLFVVSTMLMSSIRSNDDNLHRFMSTFENYVADSRSCATNELLSAVMALSSAPHHSIVRLHPLLLNALLHLMSSKNADVSRNAFLSVIHIVDCISSCSSGEANQRNELLDSYLHHHFNQSRLSVLPFTMLPAQIAMSSREEKQHALLELYGWFLFDLFTKSAALALGNDVLKDENNRTSRLEKHSNLLEDLRDMFGALAQQIRNNVDVQEDSVHLLNKSIAFFFHDLLALFDRGVVFGLIDHYFYTLDPHSRYLPLVKLKVTALRVLNRYEHYVLVNLPVANQIDHHSKDLSARMWKTHFLVGLQLNEVRQCLDYRQKEIRSLAANALLEQLCFLDRAFATQKQSHARIVDMFFSFVSLLLERAEFVRSLLGGKTGPPIVVTAGGGSVVEHEHRRELRTWLAAFLFVIRDCNVSMLRAFLRTEPATNVERFFDVLAICVEYFQGCHFAVHREIVRVCLMALDIHFTPLIGTKKADAALESAFRVFILLLKLSGHDEESLSLVFTAARRFIHNFKELLFLSTADHMMYCGDLCLEFLNLCDSSSAATRNRAASLLFVLMRQNWITTGQSNFFRSRMQTLIAVSKLTQRGTIEDYSRINSALQAVCDAALSEFPPNADSRRNLRAMSFATTLEVKATGDSAPSVGLDSSTNSAGGASADESTASQSFGEQVENLIQRMFAVIRDNQNIMLNRDDPEFTSDLFYQVSCNYIEMPVLRVTWLDNMAGHHSRNGNLAEAAQCKLYIAFLIGAYLADSLPRSERGGVPKNASFFTYSSPNLAKESASPKLKFQEGMYDSPTFSLSGLVRTLTMAIEYLKQAQMFEAAIDVYSILVAIQRHRNDFAALQKSYSSLSNVCGSLVTLTAQGRFFPCYYRVAFFGKKFGAFDRKEFIYKEHSSVKIVDITERLRAQFGRKFGESNVEILPNKPIDYADLDKNRCYLQLATVTPYEASMPPFNCSRFMLQVPFTKATETSKEKTHGGVAAQYIRRTIFTAEGSFPWINNRQFIASKEVVELTPIENANELIRTQTEELRRELKATPPNRLAIQRLLQGSVNPQVHGGTLEVAEAFLGAKATPDLDEKQISALGKALGEFLHECREAIEVNRKLCAELAPTPPAPVGGGTTVQTNNNDSSSSSTTTTSQTPPTATNTLLQNVQIRERHSSGSGLNSASAAELKLMQQEVQFQVQIEAAFNALVRKLKPMLSSKVSLPALYESAE